MTYTELENEISSILAELLNRNCNGKDVIGQELVCYKASSPGLYLVTGQACIHTDRLPFRGAGAAKPQDLLELGYPI